MAKIRCRFCTHFDYNHLDSRYEPRAEGEHFCGLHGMAPVDPDGPQVNLDHRGGCGYYPKKRDVQLTFDFQF